LLDFDYFGLTHSYSLHSKRRAVMAYSIGSSHARDILRGMSGPRPISGISALPIIKFSNPQGGNRTALRIIYSFRASADQTASSRPIKPRVAITLPVVIQFSKGGAGKGTLPQ
jgi:hypothetical protein